MAGLHPCGARLGAVQLYGAQLRRVRVEGGKIDYLNLRGASLRDVQFVDCVLTEPDLGGATLNTVTFDGCRLVSPDFSQAVMRAVDLSGADLVAPRGLASLAGATISRSSCSTSPRVRRPAGHHRRRLSSARRSADAVLASRLSRTAAAGVPSLRISNSPVATSSLLSVADP